MSNVNIVRSLPEAEWRRFIENNPNSNIFHTPEMFEVYASAKRHRPTLWAAINADGYTLALLLPVQIFLMGGLMQYVTTRSIVYGSALWEQGDEGEKALALLLKSYAHDVDGLPLFTELRNLWDINAVLAPVFREQNFIYEEHLNYLIDLDRSFDEVFLAFRAGTQKKIRRGLSRGDIVVEEVKEREQVGGCYDLLSKTYQNAQVPLADRSLFEAAFDVLHPKGMIRFTQARIGESFAAASVELLYKDVVYGWYGGMDRTYSSYVPNELLMWNILQWGVEKGYRVYDFGGAGKPDQEYGVRDFKAKFGGALVNFGRYTCVHSPFLLHISTVGYNIVRKYFYNASFA